MILGRLWQFDVDVQYKVRDNVYVFFKDGQKFVLTPIQEEMLSPSAKEVQKSVLLIVEFREHFRKYKTKYPRVANKRRRSWMFQKEDAFLYQPPDDELFNSNSRTSSF